MKRLLFVFALLAAVARAATGDVTAVIDPSGWFIYVTTQGFTTGATYNFGMSANNTPGANTPYITVTSPSYDNTGASGTTSRRVYLVGNNNTGGIIRFPYSTASITGTFTAGTFVDGETATQGTSGATAVIVGGQSSGTKLYVKTITGTPDNSHVWTGGTSGATFTASTTATTLTLPTNDEKNTGTALVSRIALSEYICSADTSAAITAPSGFIVNSGGGAQNSNALSASTSAITNNSTVGYSNFKCVMNWSREDHQLWGATVQPAVVAYQHFGTGGHPVACVVFTVTDQHSHTVTQTVTDMSCDLNYGDAVPVVEYVGSLSTSTLTQGDTLTINAKAYPWIGDSNAILDTSDGAFSQPTVHYAPRTGICDKNNTYGQMVAVVSTAGADSGGTSKLVKLSNYADLPTAAAAAAALGSYATVNYAAAQITSYNNSNNSHNDAGGGIITVRYDSGGGHAWTGASNTIAGNPAAWLTIQGYPGDTTPIFNTTSGNKYINSTTPLYVKGLSFTTAGVSVFDGFQYLVCDGCTFSCTDTATFYQVNCMSVIRSTITTLSQGLRSFASGYYMRLIRGNTINAGSNYNYTVIRTTIGNLFNNIPGGDQTFQNGDTSSNSILAYCKYTNFTSSGGSPAVLALENASETSVNGAAFIQLLFENKSTSNALFRVCGDGSTNTPVNNVIIWNTTTAGQRWNMCYNDSGTAAAFRLYWSVKNNLCEIMANKSDSFVTASGGRVGNWSYQYGVGMTGNIWGEIAAAGSTAGSFLQEFDGLYSYSPSRTANSEPPGSATNAVGYFAFTDRQAYNSGAGAGNGTYTLTKTSPAIGFQQDWLLPFDLLGKPRSKVNAVGAYSYSSGSNFFFWFP